MTQFIELVDNDLAIGFVTPESQDDPRVPTAPDMSAMGLLAVRHARASRLEQGWLIPPAITVNPPRDLVISGGRALLPLMPNYRVDLPATTLRLPALSSTAAITNRFDHLSLITVIANVGGEQDNALGSVVFKARRPDGAIVDTPPKENTRRLRAFWFWVLSPDPILPIDFYNALPTNPEGVRVLAVSAKGSTGFTLGTHRLYINDPAMIEGKTYSIVPDGVDLLPITQIRRAQNFLEEGYTWGMGGEEPIDPRYMVRPIHPLPDNDPNAFLYRRCLEIFSGRSGWPNRTIQNLSAGAVSSHSGRAGVSASAPNGSVNLGSLNRVSYTNQAYLETHACQLITAGNDGLGNAILSANSGNVPADARFSENAADHKIYTLSGEEVSRFGRFGNLNGQGVLTWVADSNRKVQTGQQAYFVPALRMPAGSGFSVPFAEIEAAWDGSGNEIDPANIRHGGLNDLDQYTDPANDGEYFVIYGPERAALHRIYRKVTVTANSAGTITIPPNEYGVFAFVKGVDGPEPDRRWNRPVITGLSANTTYDALIYYPPRPTESWQFQMRYQPQAGMPTDAAEFLEGARVVSMPLYFAHTQGGGGQVFRGEGVLQFSPIAMFLPSVLQGVQGYQLRHAVQPKGTAYPGPITFRDDMPLLPAAGFLRPAPGQVLSVTTAQTPQGRSLRLRLFAEGRLLGFQKAALEGDHPYQSVVAFVVEKAGERRIVIATHNGPGPVDVPFDPDRQCAIGLYPL